MILVIGLYIILYPICFIRWQKSRSSPYMKNDSSNAPILSTINLGKSINEPLIASTSWILFSSRKVRLYFPNRMLLGNNLLSPINLKKAENGSGKLRLQANCKVPSGFNIFGPIQPVFGFNVI